MRILHLVSYHVFSGPLPPTLGLALAQRDLGHTVWVAADSKRGHLDNAFEEAASPSLAAADVAPQVALTLSTQSSFIEYIRDVRRLGAFVRDARVDVVHVHQSHDHGLLAFAGPAHCRRVRTVHAARSLEPRLGQGWLYQRVDGIIVRCLAHQAALLRGYAPRAAVAVLPGSIDGTRFGRATAACGAAARAAWGVPAGAPLLGMVALLANRGQAELLHALAQLQDPALHVVFVGRGSEEVPLRMLVQRLGLSARAHFAGYLQGDRLLDAYAACDAMFLAQAGNDAGARAALEAMAAGVPLMAVATDALAELVTQERGWIAARRAPDALCQMLRRWRADPAGATALAARARRYVLEHRHVTGEAAATLRFYQSLGQGACAHQVGMSVH